jgi:hypothetical protein
MRKSDRENRKRLQINSNQSMKRSINYKHEKFASFFGVKHSLGNLVFRWRFRQVNQTSFCESRHESQDFICYLPVRLQPVGKMLHHPEIRLFKHTVCHNTQLQVEGSSPRLDVRIRSYDKTRSSYIEAFILSSLIFLHITTRFQFQLKRGSITFNLNFRSSKDQNFRQLLLSSNDFRARLCFSRGEILSQGKSFPLCSESAERFLWCVLVTSCSPTEETINKVEITKCLFSRILDIERLN